MVPHSDFCGLCSPSSNSPLTLWAVRGYQCSSNGVSQHAHCQRVESSDDSDEPLFRSRRARACMCNSVYFLLGQHRNLFLECFWSIIFTCLLMVETAR